MYNLQLVNCDTDSIMVCKPSGEEFSTEEKNKLTEELNELFPEKINWELEDTFRKVIIVKAKNYILQKEDGEVKYKGSAIKAPTKEKALQEFIKEIIKAMLEDRTNYVEIYEKYVKEILNVKDMSRWCTRKTVTSKTLESQRSNESKIRDAIEGTEYVEGNRIYTYFRSDNSVDLLENFEGDYSREKLLRKLFDTAKIFSTVIDIQLFPNYSLKRNKKILEEINV